MTRSSSAARSGWRSTRAGRDDAIRRCGGVLVEVGAVDPAYVEAMLAREQSISTYVGEGVAIPHGTLEGKSAVRRDALAVSPLPGDGRLGRQAGHRLRGDRAARATGTSASCAELAEILLDEDRAKALREATDPDEVIESAERGNRDEGRPLPRARATSASRTPRRPHPGRGRQDPGTATAPPAAPTSRSSGSGHHHIVPPRVMGHEVAGEIVEVGSGGRRAGRRATGCR
jgi:PTS system mannitol-specific IIA component